MQLYYLWIFVQCKISDELQHFKHMKQYNSTVDCFFNVMVLICVFINKPNHIPPNPHQVNVTLAPFIDSLAWANLAMGKPYKKYCFFVRSNLKNYYMRDEKKTYFEMKIGLITNLYIPKNM